MDQLFHPFVTHVLTNFIHLCDFASLLPLLGAVTLTLSIAGHSLLCGDCWVWHPEMSPGVWPQNNFMFFYYTDKHITWTSGCYGDLLEDDGLLYEEGVPSTFL